MAQSVTIRVVAPRVGRVLAATGRRVLVVPSPGPPGSTGPEGPPGQFDPDQIAAVTGDLADLTTTAKSTLVAAINEAASTGGSGGSVTSTPAGGAGLSHVQAAPAATWTVPHTLGRHPAAVLVVVDGEQVDTDVAFPDIGTISIVFATPQSGRAEIV